MQRTRKRTNNSYKNSPFVRWQALLLSVWILSGGSGTNWYLKVPYGYQASKSLTQPEKQGLAPQDIVLLNYHAKTLVLMGAHMPNVTYYRPFWAKNPDYQTIPPQFQLSCSRGWTERQSMHTIHKGRHLQHICVVVIAPDALHWWYDHCNQWQSITLTPWLVMM